MKIGATKPEWDTPRDGDFATYVERLTTPAPARPAPMSGTGSAAGHKSQAAGSARAPAEAGPPDLTQAIVPLSKVLGPMRGVLLFFIVLHGVFLFVFGRGSLPGLVVMAVVWWGLGWLIANAPPMTASGHRAKMESEEQARRLKVAQQRNSGKKKSQ